MHRLSTSAAHPAPAPSLTQVGPRPLPWRAIVERLPVVAYVASMEACPAFLWLSPQVEALLGRRAEDFVHDRELWYAYVHPDDRQRLRDAERRAFEEQIPFDCEYRMVTEDGRVLEVVDRDTLRLDGGAVPDHTEGVIIDVTSLRDAERRARDAAARADSYMQLAGTLVVKVDAQGRALLVNRGVERLLGHRAEDIVGHEAFAIVAGGQAAVARGNHTLIVAGEFPRTTIEMPVLDAEGERHDILWEWTVQRHEDGRVRAVLYAGIDVTERREAERLAEHLARHDALTGLPNRRLLDEHVALATARARRDGHATGLVLIDLDHFGAVNEGLGPLRGDEVLAEVAERLAARRRAQDVLARTGGDEFAILLTGLPPESAEDDILDIADEFLATLRGAFTVASTTFELEASAGCAVLAPTDEDQMVLHRRAAGALRDAKRDGRGVARRAGGPSRPRRPLSLGVRLREAMARGALLLHWQPVVDPLDGRVMGAEGLVRWQAPEGLLMPDSFIPFAEESRLITELDDHVLGLACAEMAAWEGLDHFHFGVNLSPQSALSGDLVARVEAHLAAHGIGRDRLVVEVTEAALGGDAEELGEVVGALRRVGVHVAVDDFGTGHSSLARLLDLPVDHLKLDRSFLTGSSRRAASAIGALLGLSQGLGAKVTVEGVETEEQRTLLARLGVPSAQGYHLGRPGPGEALFERVGARRRPA